MTAFLLSVTAILAYFLGGVNGAAIASCFVFHKPLLKPRADETRIGTYFRSFGLRGVLLIFGVDLLKSVLAELIGQLLMLIDGQPNVGKLFAGFCLIMGHMYPIFYKLRGGKGLLCGAIVALMFDWRVGLGCIAVFFIVVVFTRYIALGTLFAAFFSPLFIWMTGYETLEGLIALLIAALFVVRHADNILRIIGGTEHRLNLKKNGAYGKREW